MAVELTPLGFRKPDGRELLKRFDDHVSHNAQTAEDLLSAVRARVAQLEGGLGDPLALSSQIVSGVLSDTGSLAYLTLVQKAQDAVAGIVPPLVASAIAAAPGVADAAEAAVSDAVIGMDLVESSDPRIPQTIPAKPNWDHVEVDSVGNVLRGVKTDGTEYIRKVESPSILASTDPRLEQTFTALSNWDSVEVDAQENVISGRRTNGSYYFRSIESPALSALPTKVAGFGDSMLGDHGGLGVTTLSALATALGVEVFRGGVPGQTSTEIALRQGGLDVLITVNGNTIPASGAVAVTVVQPTGTWKTGSTWTFTGTLGGILGTLTKSTTDTWTFARTTAGSAVTVKPETRWVSTEGRSTRDWVQIFRGGRNNVQAAIIARDEKAFRSGLAGNNNRHLVLPTYNSTTEPSGSAGYNAIMAINATRADTFGPNYYDLRGWLIRNGLTEAGITPTAEDLTAISEDRIPPSLMIDTVHLSPVGRTLEGQRLAHIITTKGWL